MFTAQLSYHIKSFSEKQCRNSTKLYVFIWMKERNCFFPRLILSIPSCRKHSNIGFVNLTVHGLVTIVRGREIEMFKNTLVHLLPSLFSLFLSFFVFNFFSLSLTLSLYLSISPSLLLSFSLSLYLTLSHYLPLSFALLLALALHLGFLWKTIWLTMLSSLRSSLLRWTVCLLIFLMATMLPLYTPISVKVDLANTKKVRFLDILSLSGHPDWDRLRLQCVIIDDCTEVWENDNLRIKVQGEKNNLLF